MQFPTKIKGIPCLCEVTAYSPGTIHYVSGAMEDGDYPDDPEFEYIIRDTKGHRALWLEKKITPEIEYQLYEEASIMLKAQEYELAEMACWDLDEPIAYLQGC